MSVKKPSISKHSSVARSATKETSISSEVRRQMIAEAAYFKALERDFVGDYCLVDWLEAEAQIDRSLNDVWE